MFEIGGRVIYRAEGVCVINDIRSERFGNSGEEQYYVLSPLNDPRSTIFVPLANERLVSMMRPLLFAAELMEMVKDTEEDRLEWHGDSRNRNAQWREILSVGHPRQLMVMIRTIREHLSPEVADGMRATGIDLAAKARAEKLLLDECSVTTDLSTVEKLDELLQGKWIPKDRES